ncbi:hypothetical protein B7C62_20540 [Kitasatospora albolonga]|uniref:ABC-2 type transporter transmembrane domain-containing protein n=1 Tax=Kitasatospora albolonga TaxID=68173 RepID=A0ABC8BVA6_9ACTN|nr:hypothetical protein B7C62_20540 [Kitasatospora albolonga]
MNATTAHLAALGRAEFTLFFRSKSNLVNVLLIPVMVTVGMKVVIDRFDLPAAGLTMGPVIISTAAGVILTMALYAPLVGIYVARREELLLKRLRTGEVSDFTILAGSAVPTAAAVPVQFGLITVAVSLIAGMGLPPNPLLPLVGMALGTTLMVMLAAATTAMARTVESAQVALLPGMFLLPLTSGTYIPLEVLPDVVHDIFRFLPLTPVIDLVRAGWTEGMSWGRIVLDIAVLAGWTALAAYTVRRRFRWEPRT